MNSGYSEREYDCHFDNVPYTANVRALTVSSTWRHIMRIMLTAMMTAILLMSLSGCVLGGT